MIRFTEAFPIRNDFGKMRGRRSRNAGMQSYQSGSGNFEGLSTSPKNGGDKSTENYIQPADWPDSVFQLSGQMNLLFSGGAVAYTLTADVAAFIETGTAAGLRAARMLAAVLGTYSLTGNAAGLKRGYTLAATVAAFTETGNAAALRANRKMAGSVAAFAETGNAAGLKSARQLAAVLGTFIETGNAAALQAARKLAAALGTYSLTGNDAILTYTPAGAAYTLTAAAGAFALTGNAAGLAAARKLAAALGTFVETGNAAALPAARKLAAALGTFTLTGNAAGLTYTPVTGAYTLTTTTGSFALTGNDAGLISSQVTESATSSGGWSANLRRRDRRTFTLTTSPGQFSVAPGAANFRRAYFIRPSRRLTYQSHFNPASLRAGRRLPCGAAKFKTAASPAALDRHETLAELALVLLEL